MRKYNLKDFTFIDGPWFKVTSNGKQKLVRCNFVSKDELKVALAERDDKEKIKRSKSEPPSMAKRA